MGVACAAAIAVLSGQGITIPNTFVNGTVADATQVNSNFAALAGNALNRNAGTMLGTLTARDILPSTTATYSVGSTTSKFLDAWFSGNANVGGAATIGGAAIVGGALTVGTTTTLNGRTLTWPSGAAAANTVLLNNGSDTLSWASFSPAAIGTCDLHLSASSGVAYPTTDVLAATNVYVVPVKGGQCAFYDGSATWSVLTNAQVTVAVPASINTNYDVFCRNVSNTIACDTSPWVTDTARFVGGPYAILLPTQNNVYVRSTDGTALDTPRRYIGSFRTGSVNGQTEDSFAKRWVWSYYDRVPYPLRRFEPTAAWAYNTATTRQAFANTANQVDVLIGVAEVLVDLRLTASASDGSGGGTYSSAGIGEDSTTTLSANCSGVLIPTFTASVVFTETTLCTVMPTAGRHFYSWNEKGSGSGTSTTWYGNPGTHGEQSGLTGWIAR
jgi:hypothetical protein